MKKHNFIAFYFPLALVLFFSSCANIVAPTGGPRDITPPQIKYSSLRDSMVNFSLPKVIFEFNEPIAVVNPKDAFFISPLPKENIDIQVKYKSIELSFPSLSLEPNTTYNLQFTGVKDITEGNLANSLSFNFSTGSYLDTLSLDGYIYRSEDTRMDTGIWVLLYPPLDSLTAVKTEKPKYLTKTNSVGHFAFNSLPKGNFNILALGDKNKNLLYDLGTERIAFDTNVIQVSTGHHIPLTMYTFVKIQTDGGTSPNAVGKGQLERGNQTWRFSADTTGVKRSQDLYSPFILSLPDSVRQLDSRLFALYDTTLQKSVFTSTVLDSSKKSIRIQSDSIWQSDHVYKLFLRDSAIIYGKELTNPRWAIYFRTLTPEDYGTILIRFHPIDTSDSYVLELSKGDTLIKQMISKIGTRSFYFNNMLAGNYKISYFRDNNGNGIRDNGSLELRRQPEILRVIPDDYKIKGGWDQIYDVQELPALEPNQNKNKSSGNKKLF